VKAQTQSAGSKQQAPTKESGREGQEGIAHLQKQHYDLLLLFMLLALVLPRQGVAHVCKGGINSIRKRVGNQGDTNR